ncbi:hypothetical protein CVT25_009350 [Psilocybe cyanescens]|uniref:C2 domain-containing protein n=1 Tax=Psilocybe cyanescens TaxID=93625 RepID=A0A409WW18_PSICY|nr:hypothetical protein CVT25_009350 [Psilocybe cyanescens]
MEGRKGIGDFAPRAGELPVVVLRIQVLGCECLLSKDRDGRFVAISLLMQRFHTPVQRRTTNSTYAPAMSTFDFPLYLSLVEHLGQGSVEAVVWDKDILVKEYLGEVAVRVEDWFGGEGEREREFGFDAEGNIPFTLPLVSTRTSTPSQGRIMIKLGLVRTLDAQNLKEFGDIYGELIKRSRLSLVSVPPTQGIGTIRSNHGPAGTSGELTQLEYEDDRGLSSDIGNDNDTDNKNDSEQDEEDEEFADASDVSPSPSPRTTLLWNLYIQPAEDSFAYVVPSVGASQKQGQSQGPRLQFNLSGSVIFGRAGARPRAGSGSGSRPVNLRNTRRRKSNFEFKGGKNDIVGIVMLDIQSTDDLPRLINMTRTGWDMDPFVVISFGKKVFRTRVIRHLRNPVWDEKLLFHVHRYKTSFKVQLSVLDWDKLSSDNHIGDIYFDVNELVRHAPQPDKDTGLYPVGGEEGEKGAEGMQEYSLPLSTAKEMKGEARHNPIIRFRAKYQPYDALRQRFWRQYLTQYDTDNMCALSYLELCTMLNSLGSTLTPATMTLFFTRYGKRPLEDEISIEQAVMCLEQDLGHPEDEKQHFSRSRDAREGEDEEISTSAVLSIVGALGPQGEEVALELEDEKQHFSRSRDAREGEDEEISTSAVLSIVGALGPQGEEVALELGKLDFEKWFHHALSKKTTSKDSNPVERVINVENCPLCHRLRLKSKAEMDIVTHLAVCASRDWNKVDKIVAGDFVTASQAQRKWYVKVLGRRGGGIIGLGRWEVVWTHGYKSTNLTVYRCGCNGMGSIC